MTSLIRFSFIDAGGVRLDKAASEGNFHDAPPMRHRGRPCRALMARTLLGGSSLDMERRAASLRRIASQDPLQYMFMDGSGGEPFGSIDGWPDCADWIHREGSGWSGRSRAAGGAFEAPLFDFWLLQALGAMSGPRRPARAVGAAPERRADGSKAPLPASADLLWDWRSAGARRLELLVETRALALAPEDEGLREAVAKLSRPEMVEPFARVGARAHDDLAGGDAALLALMDLRALERAAGTRPQASPGSALGRL